MPEVPENWKPFLLEPDNVETLKHLLKTIHPGQLAECYKTSFKNPRSPKSMLWLGVSLSRTRAEHAIEGAATLLENHPGIIEFLVDGWLDSLFADAGEQHLEIDRDNPCFHIVMARLNTHEPMSESPSWDDIESIAVKLLSKEKSLSKEANLFQKTEQLSKDAKRAEQKAAQEASENKRLTKQVEALKKQTKKLESSLRAVEEEGSQLQEKLDAKKASLGEVTAKYDAHLHNSEKERHTLKTQLDTLQQEKAFENNALQTKLTLLAEELAELKTRQSEENNYLLGLPKTSPAYAEPTEAYKIASDELHRLVAQVETVAKERAEEYYTLLLRRYDHLFAKLESRQFSEESGNLLKAELKALHNIVSLAAEHELSQTMLELPNESDFGSALAIDYELLGDDAFERMTTLLDLYAEYKTGTCQNLLSEKTNWSTLEAEPEGILLLGLEAFLNDCLDLPIRRYLKLSSFKNESLVMALSETLGQQGVAS